MPANTENPVSDPVSHPAWCNPTVCSAYYDDDGDAAYVFHAAIFNGRGDYTATLGQREVLDATGRSMELNEAYVTVMRSGAHEVHLPARQARSAGEEMGGEVGAMIVIALAALNQVS